MKNFKTSTLLLAMLLMASFIMYGFIEQNQSNGGILTVRTTELTNPWDNSMITVYEDGKVEKVELDKLKVRDLTVNVQKINNHLNSIRSKGYKLVDVAGGGGESSVVTTYIFMKE